MHYDPKITIKASKRFLGVIRNFSYKTISTCYSTILAEYSISKVTSTLLSLLSRFICHLGVLLSWTLNDISKHCVRTFKIPLPVMMVRVVLSHGVTLLPGRSRRARCCKPEPGYNTENRLLQFQTTEVLSHPSTLLPTLSGCLGDGDTQYTMSSSSQTNTVSQTHSHNNNIFFLFIFPILLANSLVNWT